MPERGDLVRTLLKDQLAERLRSDIASGQYEPGDFLPSESALMKAYGVSRNVTRQALAILRDEGLIASKGGKGSFVRGARPELTIARTAADPWSGLAFSAEPINERDYADQATAALLGIETDEMVFTQDQAADREDGTRVLTRRIVPALVIDDITTDPVPDPYAPRTQLVTALTEFYGPLTAVEDVTTLPPDADESAALNLEPGHWVIQAAHLTTSGTGRALMAEVERTAPHTHYRFPVN